jgi:cyclophilin family peptidyl-prolyl cis-trans isomerase
MKFQKLKKYFTVILLGITLFAVGCSAQSTPSQPPTSKPAAAPSASSPAKTTAAASATAQTSATPSPSTQPSQPAKPRTYSSAPAMQIDKKKKYIAAVETSQGSFKIELFASESPVTVNNFVFLSKEGFYNGVIFHRIIKTFMVQTGDPQGTGMGGPGYRFADELPPKHPYSPGMVAMANSGSNTNGSQFFICTVDDSKALQPLYTQFGQISEGMDVVQKIASVPVGPSASGEMSKPKDPPVIKSITITEQ